MKIKPVNGTKDYLPAETAIRDYMQSVILETYLNSGFERITTPIMEDIENLDKSEGGENLNLIFKILKRGEKLNSSLRDGKFDELADAGLRYDLTLPLSRYYANNRTKLLFPFKCIQIDRAYRAERPQKGRLRELTQCDIDIIGSSSVYSEIEIICTTAKAMLNLGIRDFTVKINHRQLLRSMLAKVGFPAEKLEAVCIALDKLNKIGVDGLSNELAAGGFEASCIDGLANIISKSPLSVEVIGDYCDDKESIGNLEKIIGAVNELSHGEYSIEFDITLVRGQGYYTGTVFEIESNQYNSSLAGGGRYDGLVGKFLGEQIPAVGFSIGFERIFDILSESGFSVPDNKKKVVLFYENESFSQAYSKAEELRCAYDVTLYEKPKKMRKALDKFKILGFGSFIVYGESEHPSDLI